MQALGPDLLEATAYAKTMSPEEVEETIDYLLNEVISSRELPCILHSCFEFTAAWQRSRQYSLEALR